MRQAVVIGLVVVLLASTSANARFYWPWEYHRHRVHHARPKIAEPPPAVKPNCDQINAAVKALTPNNYEQSIRSSTRKQREYISNCKDGKEP